MSIRRQLEKDKMKELILHAASDIIGEEGINKLSIRKIAKKIEYSPSIIYHYFKDKDEILNLVMQRGYSKIVTAVGSIHMDTGTPEEKLSAMTKKYIDAALKMPDEFMAAQLSDSIEALNHTSSLFKGASKKKPALTALYNCLKEIYQDKYMNLDDIIIEQTAQMIAVSTLGLIIKLILEKHVGEDQRQKLIHFFSNDIVLRMANLGK